MRRDLKGPAPAPAFGLRRRSMLGRGGASAGATDRACRRHRRGVARTATLALACGLLAMLVLVGTAGAAPPLAGTFDGSGTPAGSMTPTFISVSQRSGDVYVIDSSNDAVDIFDANGNYLSQIPGSATRAGTFSFGGQDDVAVDNSGGPNDGNVYISSESAGEVFAFDSTGRWLWESRSGISDIGGVAVDGSGNPWIGDFTNGVQELSPVDGSLVGSPILVTSDSGHLAFDAAGNIAAVHNGSDAFVYDQSGNLLHTLRTGLVIKDVAVDTSTNSVYTADRGGVTIWDSSGNVVAGTPFDASSAVRGVTVNPSDDKIYVTKAALGQVDIYDLQYYTVGVTADGTGSGSVDADSGLVRGCTSTGGTCSDRYLSGATVTLTASQDSGSNFTGWTGCDNPSGNTCTVSVTSDRTVTATFDAIPRATLRVTLSGSGSGTVTSAPSGIDCGSSCASSFDQGTLVLLTPRASPGSVFTGWSGGGCTGTDPCQITLNSDTDVTATFGAVPTVSTGGASGVGETSATVGGAVNPNGSNVTDCHIDYGTSAAYGLTAACSPNPGAGVSPVGVSASLSGLASGTTYHYRVVATNAAGTVDGSDATFTTSSPPPPPVGCPQDLSKCPPPRASIVGFTSRSLIVKIKCTGETGQTCRGKATFKAVVKVRVRHGKKTRIVKKAITVGTVSYSVAAGSTKGVKLKLTSAAKRQLKNSGLVATSKDPKGTIKLPKTKATKPKKRH